VSIPKAREKFRKFLAQKGLRVTSQRLAIFDAAFARKEHFTAEQLLDYARAIDDSVSRATVYRTLPIMTQSALMREIDIGSGEKFYMPNLEQNTQIAQVVCLDCDRIFEISAPFMEWYGSTVSSKLGLSPVSQRLQVSAQGHRILPPQVVTPTATEKWLRIPRATRHSSSASLRAS
jgi:Fe2+ or Zn2+ uptake regulation protein